MPSVLLIEDHKILGDILAHLLEKDASVRVPCVLPSGEEALAYLAAREPAERPDLVVIDLSLPGMNGIELAAALHERFPDLPCLMLSGYHEPHYVTGARAAGARGYVFKDDTLSIAPAVRRVLDGGSYFSDSWHDA